MACHFTSGAAGGCWDGLGSHGAVGLGSHRHTLARLKKRKNVESYRSSRELGMGTKVEQGILFHQILCVWCCCLSTRQSELLVHVVDAGFRHLGSPTGSFW